MSNVVCWFNKSELFSGTADITVKLLDNGSVKVRFTDPDKEYVKQYASMYQAEELIHSLAKAKKVDIKLVESYGLQTV